MSRPRVALVTGANRGIGLEVCRQLAALGHRVILTARDLSKAEAAAASLGVPGSIQPAQLEVTDPENIRTLAAQLAARGEDVDVIVNNAAILVDEREDIAELAVDDLR